MIKILNGRINTEAKDWRNQKGEGVKKEVVIRECNRQTREKFPDSYSYGPLSEGWVV